MLTNVSSSKTFFVLAGAILSLGLAGCGSQPKSVAISKNDLAKQVEGTWVGQHTFGTKPNGETDALYQEFVFKLVPSNYQHGTWTYRSSSDGTQWKTVGEGAWTILPSMESDADNYKSKSNGKFDVRVERYMTSEGAGSELFNNKKNRLWVDFDGSSFSDTDEVGGGIAISFKKQ